MAINIDGYFLPFPYFYVIWVKIIQFNFDGKYITHTREWKSNSRLLTLKNL